MNKFPCRLACALVFSLISACIIFSTGFITNKSFNGAISGCHNISTYGNVWDLFNNYCNLVENKCDKIIIMQNETIDCKQSPFVMNSTIKIFINMFFILSFITILAELIELTHSKRETIFFVTTFFLFIFLFVSVILFNMYTTITYNKIVYNDPNYGYMVNSLSNNTLCGFSDGKFFVDCLCSYDRFMQINILPFKQCVLSYNFYLIFFIIIMIISLLMNVYLCVKHMVDDK